MRGEPTLIRGAQPPDRGGGDTESSTAAVALRRLLRLATLTPAQAAHVAVEALGSCDGDSGCGDLDADDVEVGQDGTVRLAGAVTDREAAVGKSCRVAEQLARNAERPAAHRRAEDAAVLAALARCATEPMTVAAVLAELRPALAATGADRDQLRGELAALVAVPLVRAGATRAPAARPSAPIASAGSADPAAAVTGPIPSAALVREPPTPHVPAPPSTARSSRIRLTAIIGIAILVAAGVIAAVVLYLPDGHSANAGADRPATSSPAPSPSGSHATPRQPRPVPSLAPHAAGAVSRVTLRPAHTCTAGSTCRVTVRVWLRPPWLSSFTWHAALVNRCTGAVRRIHTGSMIAEPGWRSAYVTVPLQLPHLRSMAVLGVVDSPVSAASRPLPVPAGGGSCPRL